MAETIRIVDKILGANDAVAAENLELFNRHKVLALDILGSPGSGKTSLVCRTAREAGLRMAVIEGDIATARDAQRVSEAGVPVVQINTGGACHLDASMVKTALKELDLGAIDVLVIENVGNLVCPAEFYLGEHAKMIVAATTEGLDKPAKYPLAFQKSKCVVLNKTDLTELTDFRVDEYRKETAEVNGDLDVIEVSCRTGDGLENWYNWVAAMAADIRGK